MNTSDRNLSWEEKEEENYKEQLIRELSEKTGAQILQESLLQAAMKANYIMSFKNNRD